ncbi:facilitated trehalose transporter Tret1-like [Periplaneta americana]|uniref:facilitated trehalose transporter Tret1-like n=1 Tax=Periplaneta americana TaxID=6978 RepID=UPI0037E856E2
MAEKVQDVMSPLVTANGTVQFGSTTQGPRVRHPPLTPFIRQWLAAVGPLAAVTSSGMTAGYSAVLLPQLQERNSTLTVTEDEASWIASTAVLSMALGCVLSGPLMDRYGRRLAHQLSCLPFALGWLLLAGSTSLPMLYAGRFLTGLCVGLISPLSTIYIAETAGPKARGPLLAVVSFCVALGILFAHLLGSFLTWQYTAALSTMLPVICFVAMATVPETPCWLLARGRRRQAEDAFVWFRGRDTEAEAELQLLLHKNKQEQETSAERISLLNPTFLRPFLVMNLYFVVQQCSGVNAVTFYTVHILRQVGLDMGEHLATVVIDVVRVLTSTAACALLKRFDRRTLTSVSGLGSAVSLLALAAFLFATCDQAVPASWGWLPVAFLVSYVSFVSVGLVPLPWVMVGEVFPASSRGLGSGITSGFCFVVFFAVVKTGPAMFSGVGAAGTFTAYGLVALVGTWLLHLWLPETRNKTLQDIENEFRNRGEV